MPTDLDRLQGRWTITAFELDARPETPPSDAAITVTGNRFVTVGMGATYEGVINLGREKKRKTIDLVFDVGHAAGVRNLGIYELTGDRWTLCLATRGTIRPTAFATLPDTGVALETLARDGGAGPASDGQAPRHHSARGAGIVKTPDTGDEGHGAATAIEGEWKMVSALLDGKALDQSMVAWCKRVTRGDVTTVVAGPQTIMRARFTLDADGPGTIEYLNLSGTANGKRQSGIYELQGDMLRICVAPPGADRPSALASERGDGRSYTSWQRAATPSS